MLSPELAPSVDRPSSLMSSVFFIRAGGRHWGAPGIPSSYLSLDPGTPAILLLADMGAITVGRHG